MRQFSRRGLAVVLLVFVISAMSSPVRAQGQTGPSVAATDGGPASRIVFGATGHSLPAGHGYVQVGQFVFPRFQLGVTDRLSVGAGTFALYPRVLLVTPKLEVYRSPRTSAAIGVAHLFGVQGFGAGMAYAVGTRDTRNGSLSAGLGVVYARSNDGGGQVPVALFGGESRSSAHNSALFEAFVMKGALIATVVGRHTWTRFSLDYGAMFGGSLSTGVPAPVLNLNWRF